MPWQIKGQAEALPIAALTANILCARHNCALSPLYAEAGRFVRALASIDADLNGKRLSQKGSVHIFSGNMLEMWMVKVACGLFYGRIASDNAGRLHRTHVIDDQRAANALTSGAFDRGAGMYFKGAEQDIVAPKNEFAVGPLSVVGESRFVGSVLFIRGFEFGILFDNPFNKQLRQSSGFTHRPSEFISENRIRAHSVLLTWPADVPPRSIHMAQVG
jgi:hypothetical protein